MTPLSGRVVLAVALSLSCCWLWWAGGAGLSGGELAAARFDALKIGLSVGVGGGGVFALYLAWRRQRSTEQTMIHTEEDARERRITELYTKAVEQLGSDKAPVRLGGLYALERLAQNNPDQRQVIVNVLCAYLRIPASEGETAGVAEREVRATFGTRTSKGRRSRKKLTSTKQSSRARWTSALPTSPTMRSSMTLDSGPRRSSMARGAA